MQSPANIYISAGETSGENLALQLIKDIKNKNPNINFFGMGSKRLQQAGVKRIIDNDKLAIVGIGAIITVLPKILLSYWKIKRYFRRQRPHLVILIDFSGFHLPIAKLAKKFNIKVMYYVSPQIWASRPQRIKKIKRYVDHMVVLYAFEKTLYQQANIPVTFAGHPIVKQAILPNIDKQALYQQFNLDPQKPIVAILPGSRQRELKYCFTTILAATKLIQQQHPSTQFVILLAPHFSPNALPQLPAYMHIVQNHNYEIFAITTAAITVSGTITMELALFKVPMVILYKVDKLTAWIAERLLNVLYIGLCNIIGPEPICRELVQQYLTPQAITDEINKLLSDFEYRHHMIDKLAKLRDYLFNENGNANAAEVALALCKSL